MKHYLFYSIWIFVCGLIAKRKGRNVIAWGASGFFFGIFAMIVLLILPEEK